MDNIDNYISILKKENEKRIYKLWECFACGKKFGSAGGLETHLRINHEELFEQKIVLNDNVNKVRVANPVPPLGLTPRFITDEHRFSDIIEAMKRFRQAKQSIPDEWIDEMIEILDRREKK